MPLTEKQIEQHLRDLRILNIMSILRANEENLSDGYGFYGDPDYQLERIAKLILEVFE